MSRPIRSGWARPTRSSTASFPSWQIAYHGIILSNPVLFDNRLQLSARIGRQTATSLTQTTRRLKLYEFGGSPTFYFNPYTDLKPIKEAYDEYHP